MVSYFFVILKLTCRKGGVALSVWTNASTEKARINRGFFCAVCGVKVSKNKITKHHKWPKNLYGEDTSENCENRCSKCEEKDLHWVAKNSKLVRDLLINGNLKELARIMPDGILKSLPHDLSYYQNLVISGEKAKKKFMSISTKGENKSNQTTKFIVQRCQVTSNDKIKNRFTTTWY